MVYRLEQKDELWYILDYRCFEQMGSQIYPIEPQLNNANSSNTEGPFLSVNCLVPELITGTVIHSAFMHDYHVNSAL